MPPPAPRLRVRVYLWLDRWLQRWVRLLGVLHEGFWLGCLDPEDLTALTILSFQQSRMYNGPEHNLSGLFPWERETITASSGQAQEFWSPLRVVVGNLSPCTGLGSRRMALTHSAPRRDQPTAFAGARHPLNRHALSAE
jgi:hypothetical protein